MTAKPLANLGEEVRVVDSVLRGAVGFQPAAISTPEWSLLYAVGRSRAAGGSCKG